MSYSVEVTATAEADLARIVDYLSQKLGSPAAALKVVDEFESLAESLEELPKAHALVKDELLALAGYRWSPVSSYMAFFTVDEDAKTVTIERVLHGSRNWMVIVKGQAW